jgi:hypothetical protein
VLTPIFAPIAGITAVGALAIDATLVATGQGDWKALAVDGALMALPVAGRWASQAATLRRLEAVRPALNETARAFSPQERRMAQLLRSEGRQVKSVGEKAVRTPDALVDGVPTEFKSLRPGATNITVKAALGSAKGQARRVVIDARGSGLTRSEADRGIRRFLGAHPQGLDHVRIVGDGWDIHHVMEGGVP